MYTSCGRRYTGDALWLDTSQLAPQIYGISKYRDMYLYSEEIDLIVHIQRRYKDTVVVSIVLSILGTWAALYGLYYKIYER